VLKLALYINTPTGERRPRQSATVNLRLAQRPDPTDPSGREHTLHHPSPPEFNFELTEDGAIHNLEVLRRYDFDLGKALKAQENSPLGNGQEFRPTTVLHDVFGLHPLWQRMKDFLEEGSIWPLAKLSKEEQQNDIEDALAFGNHKGASQKPKLHC
jgi:hypothetical protein